jgi:hypothetical protein
VDVVPNRDERDRVLDGHRSPPRRLGVEGADELVLDPRRVVHAHVAQRPHEVRREVETALRVEPAERLLCPRTDVVQCAPQNLRGDMFARNLVRNLRERFDRDRSHRTSVERSNLRAFAKLRRSLPPPPAQPGSPTQALRKSRNIEHSVRVNGVRRYRATAPV